MSDFDTDPPSRAYVDILKAEIDALRRQCDSARNDEWLAAISAVEYMVANWQQDCRTEESRTALVSAGEDIVSALRSAGPTEYLDVVWKGAEDAIAAENRNAELRKALMETAEVLNLMDSDGKRAAAFNNVPEDGLIRELCEKIGYGAVMDSAARQWFKKDPVGAITTGACAITLRNLKASVSAALSLPRKPSEAEGREA